ncbi:MAG: hypothetical protein VR65_22885 [Desulfobulbaceae bacterium BRH_c16a]|nr:MAG: hypothetical protein VR65_22885 [Desulfobulbaceae bacterium BRH_c16a]
MRQKSKMKNSCCFTDKIKACFAGKQCHDLIAPLTKKGQPGRVKVCKITGDRKICARMASMGVYPGVEADIVCAENGNRCILKVHGGTISLDADISANIFVTSL